MSRGAITSWSRRSHLIRFRDRNRRFTIKSSSDTTQMFWDVMADGFVSLRCSQNRRGWNSFQVPQKVTRTRSWGCGASAYFSYPGCKV
jgi:hypothetical protein